MTTPWPWWRFALTCLSTLGLALSAFLAWHYLMGGTVIGCTGDNSCDQILSSRWSAVRGVLPVSGLAAGAYLAILLASFFIGPATAAPDQRLAWGAMLVLAGAAAGSAVWFTFVQMWIVGAFCPYCMATHITGLLLAALIFCRAPQPSTNNLTDAARPLARWPAIGLTSVGLAMAALLATLQLGFIPPSVAIGGESAVRLPTFDPHAVPLVGSPDAPHVVTLLFDYQCSHCQRLHTLLEEAIARDGGTLAFALCPAPLNNQCNPYIARYAEEFKDSCQLANVALAVWVAKRQAFPEFDRWMFSPEPDQRWRPRTLAAARAKAAELVGQAQFNAAQADPWIERYLQMSVQLFGATDDAGQAGNAVPKLVFGTRWLTTDPMDTDDLLLLLHDKLAVPRP